MGFPLWLLVGDSCLFRLWGPGEVTEAIPGRLTAKYLGGRIFFVGSPGEGKTRENQPKLGKKKKIQFWKGRTNAGDFAI